MLNDRYQAAHSFHIPVMGIGFTLDTPIKVAHYGISSVISLVDDQLLERIGMHYAALHKESYQTFDQKGEDPRAKRITVYLDLVDKIVKRNVEEMINEEFEAGSRISTYFELLSDHSPLKERYREMLSASGEKRGALAEELRRSIVPGSIDVNIMTKLDRINYKGDEPLSREFSDALSALRGYAKSSLNSAVVFSAGINPKLYSSLSEYDDFFVDETGRSKKRVVVKVSDFRSALTQGKFLAKKGIWVSEFRIESSLNCGGHAFPNDGLLLGPVLEEFKAKKEELIAGLFELFAKALQQQKGITLTTPPPTRFSVQGGVGTSEEHHFLLTRYEFDSVGWGTPFLLVPEATTVDEGTLQRLVAAREADLYLSDASPLGVPFNNLRNSISEETRLSRIKKGVPGSPCLNGYLATNTEFTDKPICVASRAYQKRKLDELRTSSLSDDERKRQEESVLAKSCICFDLGAGAMVQHGVEFKQNLLHPAVCPGPNLAYFSRLCSLSELVGHIYGREDVLDHGIERPHLFIKELLIYLGYLEGEREKGVAVQPFIENLKEGIGYYRTLVHELFKDELEVNRFTESLDLAEKRLEALMH